MRHINSVAASDRCYCGWELKGKCYNCPPDATLEQRLKVQCPDPRCQNYPHLGGKPTITHNIACSMPDWQPRNEGARPLSRDNLATKGEA